MRIALMTNNYKPIVGGVPISIEKLSESLKNQGHEVTIFAPTYDGRLGYVDGVFRYKTLLKKFYGGVVLPNAFDPDIEREFASKRYDVIHVHHPFWIGNEAAYLSKKYDVPLAFTYHTRYEQYLDYVKAVKLINACSRLDGPIGSMAKRTRTVIDNRLVTSYINSFSKRCDCVFAPTPEIGDYLKASCRIEEEKVKVLPTGLDSNQYSSDALTAQAIRNKYIEDDGFLFVSVSRIAQEKNVEFLIEAMRRLKERTDKKFKLLVIGDGPKREEYVSLCRKYSLDEIEFTGNVDNSMIKNYCAAADGFLFASKTETQGIVIIEALAVGTPVIAVSASGVRDVVKDSENGILTSENVDEYVSRLYSYMRGDINIDRYSENAVKTALLYKEDRVAEDAVRAYKAAIINHRLQKVKESYGRKISYLVG